MIRREHSLYGRQNVSGTYLCLRLGMMESNHRQQAVRDQARQERTKSRWCSGHCAAQGRESEQSGDRHDEDVWLDTLPKEDDDDARHDKCKGDHPYGTFSGGVTLGKECTRTDGYNDEHRIHAYHLPSRHFQILDEHAVGC